MSTAALNRLWNSEEYALARSLGGILQLERWRIGQGQFFSSENVEHVDSVIVLGETVRRQLFGECANPSESDAGGAVDHTGFHFATSGRHRNHERHARFGQRSSGSSQLMRACRRWKQRLGAAGAAEQPSAAAEQRIAAI
jgi:hypothetical protein